MSAFNLRNKTKLYSVLAILLGLLSSALDIFFATIVSNRSFTEENILPLIILIMRSQILMACNYFILKFSIAAELDLKEITFDLSSDTRDNYFNLISFNTAHMALTSCLRVAIEICMIAIIVVYICVKDMQIILASSIIGSIYGVIFFGIIKYSNNIRRRTAEEQSIFIKKGLDLVALSDVAKQIGGMKFFRNKLRLYSLNYAKYSVKSLFIAQSFKPILEPMIFVAAIYLVSNYSVSGAILYLLYRVANSFVAVMNGLPLIDHYFKQFDNVTCPLPAVPK